MFLFAKAGCLYYVDVTQLPNCSLGVLEREKAIGEEKGRKPALVTLFLI